MTDTTQIREHAKVVGSDGQHVGTVDKVDGNTIILTKSDPTSGGIHHTISADLIASVEQNTVRLNVPAEQARQQWQESSGEMKQATGGMR